MEHNKKCSPAVPASQNGFRASLVQIVLRVGSLLRAFLYCIPLLFIAIFLIPLEEVLVVRNRAGHSERVYSAQALNGFCIAYTHSVNKGRVHDYYKIKDGRFVIYRTEFTSYGAGMPELAETPEAIFKLDENTFAMEYERDVSKKFLLAVGVIAEHSITIDGKEYFLKDFFAPQTSLEFCVKRISLFEKLGGAKWKTQTTQQQKAQ